MWPLKGLPALASVANYNPSHKSWKKKKNILCIFRPSPPLCKGDKTIWCEKMNWSTCRHEPAWDQEKFHQFTFHISLPSLKFTIFILWSQTIWSNTNFQFTIFQNQNGNGVVGTCSVGVTVMIWCFCHLLTQCVYNCSSSRQYREYGYGLFKLHPTNHQTLLI